MCGIAGQVQLDSARPAEPALVRRMTDSIAHRGPDGEGQYAHGPVAFGHRRLSIIDLHTGAQPMCNEDGTVWIVFNGEIYNHLELRRELVARGHRFKSSSDTEVIVHLYEEYGEACVERLKGMFAFALHDQRAGRVFLARDRVGIKPLYYTVAGGSLRFASEIKALFACPSVSRRLLPRGIDRYLTYYYVPGSETAFDGILKLEPGHAMTIADGRIRTFRYWQLRFDIHPRWTRFDDAVDALRALLGASVASHLMSDVPVGVLLSGGVDSTGVLRHAAEHSGQSLHTFTVGFEGQDFADERPYARLAAKRFGTRHREITLTAADFAAFLPRYVEHMEEPVCEPPAVALYHVAQCARDARVKVLLSGEGGDEAFAGYNKYAHLLALEAMKRGLGPARALLRVALRTSAQLGARSLPRFADLVDMTPAQYYLSCTSSPFTPFNRMKRSLYRADFAEMVDLRESDQPTRRLFDAYRGRPLLNRMLHVDTATWLPNDLLVKADKMTMAASVELRVPLLDSDVLEFAASLPPHHKIRGWPPKRILRAALKDSVPPEILRRKKIGFPVPYDRWLRTELRELAHDTILSRASVLNEYFERDALIRLLDTHGRGEGGAQEVFTLLVLDLTHRHFVAGEPASTVPTTEPAIVAEACP
jgi:asparagine synthase (glutamine-hydrolysing)